MREGLLPQRLEDADGDAVAEVEAPCLGADGDADAFVIMRGEQVFGQALRLLAEHQIAAVRIVCLVILPRRLCRKEAEAVDVVFREKVVEVFIDAHIDQIPVVQPRTLDRLVRNIKAERLDQMQDAAGGGAGAGDVARVGRDLLP